ncbi:hypothetical protein [Curtobacterium sp. MCSS17_016]|uniref:hypothetical protein n=1 Tax=Curtobacterium sp. MCSS17_016 TaxID=2175644 RepID=UPI000DA98595|nr:hypothetical protein [Curtobacterium sp. MCSS17_016]WIE81094.1 hypothetical protein DEJ19_021705 [Curtobacterium sp. MCSS17_016]
MTMTFDARQHPRNGDRGLPGHAGQFAHAEHTTDVIDLGLTHTTSFDNDPLALTPKQDSQRQVRIAQGVRADTTTWRPSDDLSGVRYRTGGDTDELKLKAALVFAPERSGGSWTISRKTVVDDIDNGAVNDERNMGPYGATFFDALAARGALVPVSDGNRAEYTAAYERGRRAHGDTSSPEEMQAQTDALYEIDADLIIQIYPELTKNGDAWHDHAASYGFGSRR